MTIELSSSAEANAQRAEKLQAFGGLNLLHIKRQVASLLGLIGRESLFDQYTKHDISHIDEMLANLDWIVPETTKKWMSHADWLMIVLAVYFHDLGMLVTTDEYKARESSGFPAFRDQILFAGPSGADYKANVDQLQPEPRERFLYQEFVRYKHAERIRAWIMGQTKGGLGQATAAAAEVGKLLEPLGELFRRDFGIICESHHLDDLDDLHKYKVSQPYGKSDSETVNLQYCAVLLRTADLLHITSDRTPSIEFRTINPSDPISQQEWAKQMAVNRVRSKWGNNVDGNPDENAPRDTVEVHAYFTKEDGFFGLTSYLGYATEQLRKSNEWIANTQRLRLAKHEFPWRRIDDSNIETEGFIRDAFEFTIDQARILDLLTGHTLYNDTNVVVRELAQNAIDAIRLKHFPASPSGLGRVTITWNSHTRVLEVQDNGTGMTQEIINRFLLKVGSSRYQDPEFVKNNPDFSSISRFGIGVLSTFMIADSVEIISCHPDEDRARRLMLRSVHGKYLIRLLDKGTGDPGRIGAHGTIFRLRVRPSVKIEDVAETAARWIVLPDCQVTVQVDDGELQTIGHSSTAEALRSFLRSSNFDFTESAEESTDLSARRLRIVERRVEGVDLAYALVWNRWFKEWSFLRPDTFVRRLNESFSRGSGGSEMKPLGLGTCVEGIRIVNDSPGFPGYPIVSIANVRGKSAPKTNVARSGLEATPERDTMLAAVYSLYAAHVQNELAELSTVRGFSPTWATGETSYLLEPLLGDDREKVTPLSQMLLQEALSRIPCVMTEEKSRRVARSPKDLAIARELWTIDCGFLTSAESLIREVSSAASLSELVTSLGVAGFEFPDAPVVCGRHRPDTIRSVFEKKEVDRIIVNSAQRRVDLHWVERSTPTRWLDLSGMTSGHVLRLVDSLEERNLSGFDRPWVPADGVVADVPPGVMAVRAFGSLYLVPGSEIANFSRKCLETFREKQSNEALFVVVTVLGLIAEYVRAGHAPADAEKIRKSVRNWDKLGLQLQVGSRVEDAFDFTAFTAVMLRTNWKSFDTGVWHRGRFGSFDFE